MIRVLTIDDVKKLIEKVGIKSFILQLIDQLEKDYSRWQEFKKSPRPAIYFPEGVIEVMPIADQELYSFKYVNGHPENPKKKKLTVVGLGLMAHAANGYPFLFSEMTLLTAFRTAATSALASKYLARKGSKTFGIIGTGAQSEFQTLAHLFALDLKEIYYFDIDPQAMKKFQANLKTYKLIPCKSAEEVAQKSDVLTIAVAAKGHQKIVKKEWVKKGTHLNGIGGDSPGKTELDPALTAQCKIIVQFLEQTKDEGEIQMVGKDKVYAELWELAAKKKPGRESNDEITLFDSVGFALEDFSTLYLVNLLAEKENIGHHLNMIPEQLQNPKNLFSLL